VPGFGTSFDYWLADGFDRVEVIKNRGAVYLLKVVKG